MRFQKIEGEHRDKCVSNNCRRLSVLQQKSDDLFHIPSREQIFNLGSEYLIIPQATKSSALRYLYTVMSYFRYSAHEKPTSV